MKKEALAILFLSTLGFSQSLDSYFEILKQNNPTLKSLKNSIYIDRQKTKLSSTWENPNLSLGVNDLLLDDFSKRNIEPMQTQSLSLSQKIPTNSKLSISESISKTKEAISKELYKDGVLKLESSLAFEIYNYQILKKKIALYNRYIKNIKKINSIHLEHLSISQVPQTKIEETNIVKNQLLIKRNILKRELKTTKFKIQKLLFTKPKSISISLNMRKNISIDIYSHPLIKAYKLKQRKAYQNLKLKRAKKVPDVKLKVGYFQREDRSDYLSVGLSLPLPVRGREESDIQIALRELDNTKLALKDIKNSFSQEVSIYKEQLKEAKKNYYLIKNTLLPNQKEIGKLLENEVYTKNKSTTSLVQNLNSIIALELQALEQQKEYFLAYSKLIYFMGRI